MWVWETQWNGVLWTLQLIGRVSLALPRVSWDSDGEVHILSPGASDVGIYRCTATNDLGSDSETTLVLLAGETLHTVALCNDCFVYNVSGWFLLLHKQKLPLSLPHGETRQIWRAAVWRWWLEGLSVSVWVPTSPSSAPSKVWDDLQVKLQNYEISQSKKNYVFCIFKKNKIIISCHKNWSIINK